MSDNVLNQAQIEELRELLDGLEQELLFHLKHADLATRPVTLDQQSVGRVSRIDAIQQQQMASTNRQQSARNLWRVQLALKRIESGEYGYCLHCGETIAFARLQAQAFSSLCLQCQLASESN